MLIHMKLKIFMKPLLLRSLHSWLSTHWYIIDTKKCIWFMRDKIINCNATKVSRVNTAFLPQHNVGCQWDLEKAVDDDKEQYSLNVSTPFASVLLFWCCAYHIRPRSHKLRLVLQSEFMPNQIKFQKATNNVLIFLSRHLFGPPRIGLCRYSGRLVGTWDREVCQWFD